MSNLNIAMSQAAAAGLYLDGAWDLSYAYYDDPLAWNISSAVFRASFSVSVKETGPRTVFFKPDGTKMYVMGQTGDDVNAYNLSTPWDITTAVYSLSFSVAAQDTVPTGLFFKPDGTKMYVVGVIGGNVNEYNLSTPWDVSTAVFSLSFSVLAQDNTPIAIFFKPDGTKMYVLGNTGQDVNEYDLSTPWDTSTAIFSQLFSVAAQEPNPQGIFFKLDGTKMYICGSNVDTVHEYNLSTPWDVSSSVFSLSFSVAAQDIQPLGIFFKPDGTKMYVVGFSGQDVNEYNLSGFSVAAQEASPCGLSFKPDGTKMYVTGSTGDDVNEYDLSTPWDTSTAIFSQLFSVAAQETLPQGIFFKPDGTKMYICGFAGQDINEYNLSTPWDVSTATFSQLKSVGAQDTNPKGLFFKPDGSKMYVTGNSGQDINEYNLSTPWDVSTASFLQLFSVLSQETSPFGLFFKPDGTKMYVMGITGDDVNEYNLSTAWDISTAVFSLIFSVAAQDTVPFGLFFKPDGTKMFIMENVEKKVYTYSLKNQA